MYSTCTCFVCLGQINVTDFVWQGISLPTFIQSHVSVRVSCMYVSACSLQSMKLINWSAPVQLQLIRTPADWYIYLNQLYNECSNRKLKHMFEFTEDLCIYVNK